MKQRFHVWCWLVCLLMCGLASAVPTTSVNNASAPVYADVKIVGALSTTGSGTPDVVGMDSGKAYVPQNPERFSHDADGNLVQDGRWNYTWDGENRLVSMETLPVAVSAGVPKQKLTFTYDAQGRRIGKQVYGWDAGTSAYTLSYERKFVYDGWNLIAELNGNGTPIRTYTWVGDQLLCLNQTADSSSHFVIEDGNKNISALVDAGTGSVTASYEYSPSGELLRSSGTMAKANPFKFSSKYTDLESGFLYYGYRYLNANTGRWLSRDPLEEQGGLNLYAFVGNDGINRFDPLGLCCDDQIPSVWELATMKWGDNYRVPREPGDEIDDPELKFAMYRESMIRNQNLMAESYTLTRLEQFERMV